ncbi:MAG TPA: 6-phosphogluconolactonase [Caulobacteraceae bacterium]
MSSIETYPDADALADAVATAIAYALGPAGAVSLVVTGGTTVGPAYDRLAQIDLEWSRVTLVLSDERFVASSSPDSNERLIRERLMVGCAARATLVPLRGAGQTPDEDAVAAEPRLKEMAPYASVLLGMGGDGHIASLFEGAPGLGEALDPDGDRLCVGVPMSGEEPRLPRISLTLAALLNTHVILVAITGAAKRAVVERVLADETYTPPVAAILRQTRAPIRVLWAP